MISGVLALALAVVLVAWTAVLLHARPALAMAAVLGSSLLTALAPNTFELHTAMATASPADIVVVALGLAAAARLAQRGVHGGPAVLALVLAVLLAVATARGLVQWVPTTVLNAARGTTYFVVSALYFALVPWHDELYRRAQRMWGVAAAVIVALAMWHWLRFGLDTFGTEAERSMSAPLALVVLQWSLMALVDLRDRGGSPGRHLGLAAGLVAVVVSQQRTVWVALVVSLVVLSVQTGRFARLPSLHRVSRMARGLLLGGALLAVAVGIQAREQVLDTGFGRAVTEPFQATNTLRWREEGWVSLIDRQLSGPRVDLVLGQPTGRGFERVVGESVVTVSAHSMYVTAFVALGLVGLGALVGLYALAWRRLGHAGLGGLAQARILEVLLAGQLVYSISYQLGFEQGLLLGLAASAAPAMARRPADAPPPAPADRARRPLKADAA